MNRQVLFYQQVTQQRPGLDIRNPSDLVKTALYVNRASALAKSLGLDDLELDPLPSEMHLLAVDSVLPSFYKLENFLNAIYARNIFEIDSTLKRDHVVLDQHWRDKVSSYISHIRTALGIAELPERLRQSILNRLNDLQAEVDRNTTRVSAAMEILAELTEGLERAQRIWSL